MNSLDSIKVPDNIDVFIDKGINKAEEKLNKQKRKTKKKIVSSVAAGIIGVVIIGAFNPVIASKIPVLKSAFEAVQNKIEYPGEYSNYATVINKTVSSEGVDITLSEVICDGRYLSVSFKVESKIPFKYIKYDYEPSVDYDLTKEEANKIEKRQLEYEGSGRVDFSEYELNNSGIAGLDGKFLDEYTFVGVERYELNNLEKIPNEFKYKLNINKLICNSWNPEKIKDQVILGSWNFEVPVKVTNVENKEIILNEKQNEYEIKKLSLTPFELIIESVNSRPHTYDGNRIRIKDENDNEYFLLGRRINGEKDIMYIALGGEIPKKLYIEVYELNDKNNLDKETVFYKKEISIK